MEGQELTKVETELLPEGIIPGGPEHQLTVASNYATAVAKFVTERKLFTAIKDKKYVHAEGWATMAAMLGLVPGILETQEIEPGRFLAKAVLRKMKDGLVVSTAESEASLKEQGKFGPKWTEPYAARSMAQTRAMSKVCRLSLSWIIAMAGYEPTPAEELTREMTEDKAVLTDDKLKLYKACYDLAGKMKGDEYLKKVFADNNIKKFSELPESVVSSLYVDLQKEQQAVNTTAIIVTPGKPIEELGVQKSKIPPMVKDFVDGEFTYKVSKGENSFTVIKIKNNEALATYKVGLEYTSCTCQAGQHNKPCKHKAFCKQY